MDNQKFIINKKSGAPPYLSAVGAWALAFGCAVGWGSFVMPGNTFLPLAGPVGSAVGLGLGAVIMLIIGVNYHYLMNRFPDSGGTYTYTKKCFGYDHGFLSAWFLILTYIAIIWANATALPLIARTLLGSTFQFGFDYEIAGFHIYMGEILLSIVALVIAALVCLRRKRAEWTQILMAVLLFAGIVICFTAGAAHSASHAAAILLTSYNWDIIEEEAAANGIDGIMAKPLFSDSLLTQIRTVLEKRQGTGFSEPAGEEEPKAAEIPGILAGCRVLMAEDVDQNAEILEDLLDLEDIKAEHAVNGQVAVQMFADRPEGYYDAVLMDVRMPVMDGLTAAKTIREMDHLDAKTIPIIAMTANVFDEDVERSLQAGMNAHLSKHVEPDRLYETLARLIEARRQHADPGTIA